MNPADESTMEMLKSDVHTAKRKALCLGYWVDKISRETRSRLPKLKKFVKRKRKKKTSFTTRQGLLVIFSIGTFVALIFALVYFVWFLPIQRSLE